MGPKSPILVPEELQEIGQQILGCKVFDTLCTVWPERLKPGSMKIKK